MATTMRALRFDDSVYAAVRQRAELEGRSMSALIHEGAAIVVSLPLPEHAIRKLTPESAEPLLARLGEPCGHPPARIVRGCLCLDCGARVA